MQSDVVLAASVLVLLVAGGTLPNKADPSGAGSSIKPDAEVHKSGVLDIYASHVPLTLYFKDASSLIADDTSVRIANGKTEQDPKAQIERLLGLLYGETFAQGCKARFVAKGYASLVGRHQGEAAINGRLLIERARALCSVVDEKKRSNATLAVECTPEEGRVLQGVESNLAEDRKAELSLSFQCGDDRKAACLWASLGQDFGRKSEISRAVLKCSEFSAVRSR